MSVFGAELDTIRLLNDLHHEFLVDERHRHRPTLVGSVSIGDARKRHFAELLYDLRCPGLQDRVGIIADQLVVVAHAFHARRKGRKGQRAGSRVPGLLRPARLVRHRARTRCRRLEPGKGRVKPDSGKARDRGGAVARSDDRCHGLPEGWRHTRRCQPDEQKETPLPAHANLHINVLSHGFGLE